MEQIAIQIISGAIGGNAVGAAKPDLSLGTLGNTIAGLIGGLGGGTLLSGLLGGAAGGGLDLGSIVSQAAGGGVGGLVLTAVVGLVKSRFMSN